MTSPPYDDVFRTIQNDCSRMLLPLLNEVFGENYLGDEKITFEANEHFLNRQDGASEKRITDSNFTVHGKGASKKYHLECQSTDDSSMLIRIFEYDTQISLDSGDLYQDTFMVRFPHSAVLFLRSTEATPSQMNIVIWTPGGEVSYNVPVIKVKSYTLEEIFEKRLWLLIPFYIFNYEKRFSKYEKDPALRQQMLADYERIVENLEELSIQHIIDARECAMLLDLSKQVLKHIAKNYRKVKKEVRDIMGGRVLEYESKKLWRKALKKGKAEGIAQGKAEGVTEGKAEAVLVLLTELGEIPVDLQRRIQAETDPTHLTYWLKLTFRAESIEDFRKKAGI